jgi:hypothetical protein
MKCDLGEWTKMIQNKFSGANPWPLEHSDCKGCAADIQLLNLAVLHRRPALSVVECAQSRPPNNTWTQWTSMNLNKICWLVLFPPTPQDTDPIPVLTLLGSLGVECCLPVLGLHQAQAALACGHVTWGAAVGSGVLGLQGCLHACN